MSDLFDKSIRTLELPRVLVLLSQNGGKRRCGQNGIPGSWSC